MRKITFQVLIKSQGLKAGKGEKANTRHKEIFQRKIIQSKRTCWSTGTVYYTLHSSCGTYLIWYDRTLGTPRKAILYTSANQGVHFNFYKCCTALWRPTKTSVSVSQNTNGQKEGVLSQCTRQVHFWDLSSPGHLMVTGPANPLDKQDAEVQDLQLTVKIMTAALWRTFFCRCSAEGIILWGIKRCWSNSTRGQSDCVCRHSSEVLVFRIV